MNTKKHLEWLKEREAFLENTDCISQALEVRYIISIVKELVKEKIYTKEDVIKAGEIGEINYRDKNTLKLI